MLRAARISAALTLSCLAGCGSSTQTITVASHSARTSTAAAEVVLRPSEDCGKPEVKPALIYLACGDGGIRLENIHWTRWGSPIASATGTIERQGCDPSCAQDPRTYSYEATITAHVVVSCGRTREYAFLAFTADHAPDVAKTPTGGTVGYDCDGKPGSISLTEPMPGDE